MFTKIIHHLSFATTACFCLNTVMASLLLLASELLRHSDTDLTYSTSTPLPFYSCGATTSTGVPCFTENRAAKLPEISPARDQYCYKEDDSEENIADLRICVVDIVWPWNHI
ncbi:hypothetical protein POM88_031518 [Heracleum sosnowskyi]|uniref:Uncharacterized protein n=1 Tax=Heracleum sosnowskyi TaxID=360622 RepID=A0AAD8I0H9_9APIA|nr:hypothetical protein POM88_031518 [Heracleum sosnowskyi]